MLPTAIRITNRFHVNVYVIECVQNVRKNTVEYISQDRYAGRIEEYMNASQYVSKCLEVAEPIQLNWIPLVSLDEMAQREYDVLIVGSGAGGGAALWRLCQRWGG
ncbi:hypothetical protein D3C75_341630 [compost metagenome]